MKQNKKGNNKKRKLKKLIIVFVIIVLLASASIFAFKSIFSKPEGKVEAKSKVVDSIKKYGYTISDNDTKLFKSKFNELKKVLNEKEVDNEKYSKLVAELFIIDFYTLDNKSSKNDVGGVEYVFDNYKASFIDKARDEFYKYVKNNLNDDRDQDLPVVSSIKVDSIEKVETMKYFEKEDLQLIDEAYKVELTWSYEKDLGYSDKATIIVIKDGDIKFSVAKLIGDEE